VTGTLHNVRIFNNVNIGVRADVTGTTGTSIVLKIDDTNIDNNSAGLLAKAPAGTGTVRVMINNSSISLNTGGGIAANGPGAVVRVAGTAITGNATGVVAGNSGVVSSYGNNQLDGNTNDGAFSGAIPPK